LECLHYFSWHFRRIRIPITRSRFRSSDCAEKKRPPPSRRFFQGQLLRDGMSRAFSIEEEMTGRGLRSSSKKKSHRSPSSSQHLTGTIGGPGKTDEIAECGGCADSIVLWASRRSAATSSPALATRLCSAWGVDGAIKLSGHGAGGVCAISQQSKVKTAEKKSKMGTVTNQDGHPMNTRFQRFRVGVLSFFMQGKAVIKTLCSFGTLKR